MLEILIATAPLLLLLGMLVLGIYPGCETILRLAERLSPSHEGRPAMRKSRRPIPPPSFAACGGLLIGFGHPQRPPPLAS
jgi:hypothetical protein